MRPLLLIVLGAAALLAAAAFAGVGRPQAARGDTTTTASIVTTVGHGVVTAVPDLATITAGVHTEAATASAALSRNSDEMTKVIAALKQAGGQKIQTQQVSLSPETDTQGHVVGFAADNSVSAQAKIADAGAVIDAAVAAGANTVSGPSLSISDDDALYRQALQKAVEDARAKAQALAQAGGFAVGPVSSVTEQSTEPPIVFGAAPTAKGSTPVEPGTQDVTADVQVSFAIR